MFGHEGEIIIKETYGGALSPREIYYVKAPDQAEIVVLDEGRNKKQSNIISVLAHIFLPQGYPDSVSKDYTAYQLWDSAQAFCSTITGTLATHEVLKGMGVGNAAASPLAATVTWVVKDGSGHIGRILFAYTHGSYLDSYSKKWRLYADTLNDASMCIEMALPLFKNYTVFALCVSTAMKSIVGVAGGATRAALTQHHAVRGNLADVAAKDSAQETAVNFVASFTALAIMSLFGNSLYIFFAMMILHIVFNYLAVRSICLRTLNEPRFLQVIDTYLQNELITTPCEVNRNEPIILYQLGPDLLDYKLSGFRIQIGNSVKSSLCNKTRAVHLLAIAKIYDKRQYILYPNVGTRKMCVLIKFDAKTDDVLCAYFHAVLLSIIICSLNGRKLSVIENEHSNRPFIEICNMLKSVDWSREAVGIRHMETSLSGFEYDPSYSTMEYVDKIVQKEWALIKIGLQHTGWDLSKHLLLTNEWRICRKEVDENPITPNTSLTYLNTFENVIGRTTSPNEFDANYFKELTKSVENIPKDKNSTDSVHVISADKTVPPYQDERKSKND